MEVGYFTMPLHPPGSNLTKTLEDDMEQIVTLDGLGYSEAWIGEHFTAEWENIPAPDLFIAQALGMTKSIGLGTGVTCMPNHNPFMIAHRVAQLDHMAKGRFMWGVGSGGFSGDFEVFGVDPKSGEHRELMRDSIDLILQLWEDPKPGLYEHKYWRFNVPEPIDEIGLRFHVKPYTVPHPPMAVAGVSERSDTLEMAGERGWLPLSINLVPTRVVKTHWEAVEKGAAKAGRAADRSQWRVAREVYISDTTARARREALNGVLARDFDQYFLRSLPMSRMLDIMKVDVNMPDSDVTPEYLVDNVFIVGSPDDVAEKLHTLYEDLGGFGVLLAMGHEWEPRDKWLDSMTILKQDVMPRLAKLN